jgi:lipopolysaccharide/colanic/teichoic acid biosynthesis glycosyltransferase
MQNNQTNKQFIDLAIQVIKTLFSRENLLALLLALLVIAIYIATASESPLWVYQGF